MSAAEGLEALAYHGGALAVARRLASNAPEPWIDLSTGVNPDAYPLPRLPAEVWTRLPESDALAALERVAAARYGAKPGSVVAGPGSQALIQALAQIAPRGRVSILAPSYSGHAQAFAAVGVKVDEAASLDALADGTVGIVVNPNNPDGRIVSASRLLTLAEELRMRGGWLIADEAFADLDGACESLAPLLPLAGAVVLRSFGKTYGLPGIRLGFAVASADIACRLRAALGPWPVSGPAIAVGSIALADRLWLAEAATTLAAKSARLDSLLAGAGWRVLGGTRLFRLAAGQDTSERFTRLLAAGILTRPFAAVPDRLRFGIPGDEEQWRRLAAALR